MQKFEMNEKYFLAVATAAILVLTCVARKTTQEAKDSYQLKPYYPINTEAQFEPYYDSENNENHSTTTKKVLITQTEGELTKEIQEITVVTSSSGESSTTINSKVEEVTTNDYITEDILTTGIVDILEGPERNSIIIDTVLENTNLEGIYDDGEWYKVIYDNQIGYVDSNKVKENDKKLINK